MINTQTSKSIVFLSDQLTADGQKRIKIFTDTETDLLYWIDDNGDIKQINGGSSPIVPSSETFIIDGNWSGPVNNFYSATFSYEGLNVGDYLILTPTLDAIQEVLDAEIAPFVNIEVNNEFILYAKNIPTGTFSVNLIAFKN